MYLQPELQTIEYFWNSYLCHKIAKYAFNAREKKLLIEVFSR